MKLFIKTAGCLYTVIVLFTSCSFNKYVMRRMHKDELPGRIPADSFRFTGPAFSMYGVNDKLQLDGKLRLPEPESRTKAIINEAFLRRGLQSCINFTETADCMNYKIHVGNFRDTQWYQPASFSCLNLDTRFYQAVLCMTFEIGESFTVSAAAQLNDVINIYALLHVFKNNRIVFSRQVRLHRRTNNKEAKKARALTVSSYFTPERIEAVLKKVMGDLPDRIKP